MLTAYDMGIDATPEFHQGAAGFARYFWHNAVDQTSENYMVEFVVPSITHEDTRYYTLGRGGFFKRTGYALSRAVVTRSDAGNNVFNASEVLGAGASAGLSSSHRFCQFCLQGILARHQPQTLSRRAVHRRINPLEQFQDRYTQRAGFGVSWD
jgi:hypothetical protein